MTASRRWRIKFELRDSTPESQGQRKKGASEFTIETTNNEGTKQEKKLNLQTKGKKQEKKQREKKTNMGQQ